MAPVEKVFMVFDDTHVPCAVEFADGLGRMSVCDGQGLGMEVDYDHSAQSVSVTMLCGEEALVEKMAARAEQYRSDDLALVAEFRAAGKSRADLVGVMEKSAEYWRGCAVALRALLCRLHGRD